MTEADGEWWQPFADQQLFYYLVGDMCRERARLEAQALAEEARVLLEARRRGKRGASATIAAAAAANGRRAAKAFPRIGFSRRIKVSSLLTEPQSACNAPVTAGRRRQRAGRRMERPPDFPWWPVVANKNLSSQSRTSDDPSAPSPRGQLRRLCRLLQPLCHAGIERRDPPRLPEGAQRREGPPRRNREDFEGAPRRSDHRARHRETPKSGLRLAHTWPAGLPPLHPGTRAHTRGPRRCNLAGSDRGWFGGLVWVGERHLAGGGERFAHGTLVCFLCVCAVRLRAHVCSAEGLYFLRAQVNGPSSRTPAYIRYA